VAPEQAAQPLFRRLLVRAWLVQVDDLGQHLPQDGEIQAADSAYRSFESRPDEDTFRRAFPGATGKRVRALRARYDPDGVFLGN
jgi:hypothetical protein